MTPRGASPDWRALAAAAPATALLSGTSVQWASPGLGELVLADPSALVGTDALDLVLAADRERARAALAAALRRPGERPGPLRLRPAARPEVRLEVLARTRGGNHLVVAAWDVSHRLAGERAPGPRDGRDAPAGPLDRTALEGRWERSRTRARADPALRTFVLRCGVEGPGGAGDAVLVEVARRLAAEVRAGDTVARLGGGEFVVLVEAVPATHVQALAERLRRSVGAVQAGVHVGLSVGWVADDPSLTRDAVLAEAHAHRTLRGGSR
ncbi:diguanylate cyclase domain-containing protein [Kineococcus radiotolerans]|uniref:Diguanylate cyclase n=1 Tax=Kineococcus radiotolerans (strain ATCC BAA-149 / DSM 14245 / SRS30216) TaxID=266940 RepID=A6WFB1_KINRD|nr:diguanylate cyclase [Kineococcus radiotolerans]ABS05500.1 diguanylate cyclase [Kineococcus radiotolerans SRS30216 = ATCC BAA-149]